MTHFRIIFSTKSRAIFDVFKFGAIFESIFKEEEWTNQKPDSSSPRVENYEMMWLRPKQEPNREIT